MSLPGEVVAMTEPSTGAERFTDEDAAFLRHVRFGELPPRVRPEDLVETTETEPPRGTQEPEPEIPWPGG
jgi:hypothetical protein